MSKLTVLVVDDDQDIRDGIEIYLKNEGYAVIKAADGVEALKMLSEQEVHLIILDIMMPNMDGITATFKIRAERNIPILMLSAKAEQSDKIHGLSVGADDYITKPFHPLELMARVKSQLRRYVDLGTYQEPVQVEGLTLDAAAREVRVDGEAENIVAVHIRKIREKIEVDPKNPRYVKFVWGLGYKIEK